MPTPNSRSYPRLRHLTLSAPTRSRISKASRVARSAGFGTGTGSLKKIIMPSPVKRSSVPSWARTSLPISAWYSRRTPMTSSGSAVSAKAVNPRRSRNTTVTSRRWLRRGSSAPPATINSARWGELEQVAQLERPVPFGELGSLSLDRVVELLDPEQRADAHQQLRLVDRLSEEVVGPGLEALDALFRGVKRRHHDHREDPGRWVLADPAADLVAGHTRHDHVEQHQVGLVGGDDLQGLRPGLGGQDGIAFCGQEVGQELDVQRRVVD